LHYEAIILPISKIIASWETGWERGLNWKDGMGKFKKRGSENAELRINS